MSDRFHSDVTEPIVQSGRGRKTTAISNSLEFDSEVATPASIDAGVLSAKSYCIFHAGSKPTGNIIHGGQP